VNPQSLAFFWFTCALLFRACHVASVLWAGLFVGHAPSCVFTHVLCCVVTSSALCASDVTGMGLWAVIPVVCSCLGFRGCLGCLRFGVGVGAALFDILAVLLSLHGPLPRCSVSGRAWQSCS
jgi:hypothetical protein